jgi:hypothetical protein
VEIRQLSVGEAGLTLLSIRGVETLGILRSEARTRAMSNAVRYGRLTETRIVSTREESKRTRPGMRSLLGMVGDDGEGKERNGA